MVLLPETVLKILAVTFSRCVGCQKGQHIFVHCGHFFNFGRSQKSQRAKSGEKGGWSIFVMEFSARNSRKLNASCSGTLSWWRIQLSGQSPGLLLRTDCRNLVSNSK